MLEKIIQTAVIKHIHDRGGYCVKVQSASRNGVPDILASYRGRFIAVEVKTSEGKLSKLQTYNLEQIVNANGEIIVARSVDDVADRLNQLDRIITREQKIISLLDYYEPTD